MKPVGWIALLYDFYGPLLTERQRQYLSDYYMFDLSLGEISAGAGVSRQAVHDQVKRAEAFLLETEERLGFAKEYLAKQALVDALQGHLTELAGLVGSVPGAGPVLQQMGQKLAQLKGDAPPGEEGEADEPF